MERLLALDPGGRNHSNETSNFSGVEHGLLKAKIPVLTDLCIKASRPIVRKRTPNHMELVWLVHGDAVEGRDYDLDRLTWLWKVTTEEDKKIIEHTARGVRSRYFEPGPGLTP